MAQPGRRKGMAVALSIPSFRPVLAAFGISAAGDWLYGVALTAYVLQRTGSPSWVAVAVVIRLLPYVLFSTLSGAFADHHDRRLVMIGADIIRAGLMFGLAGVAATSGPVVAAVGITFLSNAAGTLSRPAMAGLVPGLVPEQDLAAANSLLAVLENASVALGPAVGALLLIAGSPAIAFAFNGVTFVVSAALLARVRSRPSIAVLEGPTQPLRHRLAEGLRAARRTEGVPSVIGMICAYTLMWGQVMVLLVLVSVRFLSTGTAGLGWLYSAIGIGGILAAFPAHRLEGAARSGLGLAGSIVLAGVPLALLAQIRLPAVAYVMAGLIGAGGVLLDVLSTTTLQRSLEDAVLSRVRGLVDSASVATLLLGSVVAPLVVRWLGLSWALILAGGMPSVLALLAAPGLRAVGRRAETRVRQMAPVVGALRKTDLFAGAPARLIEQVAAIAEEVRAPAGAILIREGDDADALYVVMAGRLEVIADRQGRPVHVATRSQGDYVGEIGLFGGVPRTATVRAETPSVLLRIDGERFLNVVNRVPTIASMLGQGIEERRMVLVNRIEQGERSPDGLPA